MIPLRWNTTIVQFIKGRIIVTRSRGEGEGNEELLLLSRVSVWDEEKVLGKDSSDGYITMWMYLTPLSSTNKNGKFYIFYASKKSF